MSKIGKKPIDIPAGVEVQIQASKVTVKGPQGELSYQLLDGVHAKVEGNQLLISIANEEIKNLRGLTRTLLHNMVEGVTKGYEKKLLLMGVGFNVKLEGQTLNFALGFSHKVKFIVPDSIKVTVEQDAKGNYIITLNAIDKQYLGEVAAKIRSLKEPEPYKGKGIRYFSEYIKLKPGKAAKK